MFFKHSPEFGKIYPHFLGTCAHVSPIPQYYFNKSYKSFSEVKSLIEKEQAMVDKYIEYATLTMGVQQDASDDGSDTDTNNDTDEVPFDNINSVS